MAPPAVYENAQKGVIDGVGAVWALVATYKWYDVFRYWTDISNNLSLFMVVMNEDKWNSLPKDIQDQIMSISGVKGAEFAGETQFGATVKDDAFKMMKDAGKPMERVELTPADLAEFQKVCKGMWDEWVAEVTAKGVNGQAILNKVLSLMDKYR